MSPNFTFNSTEVKGGFIQRILFTGREDQLCFLRKVFFLYSAAVDDLPTTFGLCQMMKEA